MKKDERQIIALKCDTEKYAQTDIHTYKVGGHIDCRDDCFLQPELVWTSHSIERLPHICSEDRSYFSPCGSGWSINHSIPVSLAACIVQHDKDLANQKVSISCINIDTGLDM